MRRLRNAKIIATLGPASSSLEAICALFENGADVFRLNFSHGSHNDHRESYNKIRSLEKKYGRPVCILLDLQGPKLRVGSFSAGKVMLDVGQAFRLDMDEALGTKQRAPLLHPEVFAALKPNTSLLMDDGKIRLRVLECGKDFANTKVIAGGVLSNNKGVNVPDAVLDVSPLTKKDLSDLKFGLQLGVDWVALSFVQRPSDVSKALKLIDGRAFVMSKLEKPQAMDYLDEIVELSDAIMVARGDLGVECPPEEVPSHQKRISRVCREAGKPVIVATQMLESMITIPTPTRAEASDVATAIYDGVDAVMLSAETAVGEYAPEAVGMMDRIIRYAEQDLHYQQNRMDERRVPEATEADAISAAARQVSLTISAASVIIFSLTGSTTLRTARERPPVPIIGLTSRLDIARRMALVWGVHSVQTEDCQSFREMVDTALRVACDEGFAFSGDSVVITAGVPFGTPGTTNILRIAKVE